MRFVYVVSVAWRGTGGGAASAYTSLAAALDAVERNFHARPTHVGGVVWRASAHGDTTVEVRRLRVQGGAR